jgi:hypothetical protein
MTWPLIDVPMLLRAEKPLLRALDIAIPPPNLAALVFPVAKKRK